MNVVLVRYLEGETAKTEMVDVGKMISINRDTAGFLVIEGDEGNATFRNDVVLWWKIVPKKEKL